RRSENEARHERLLADFARLGSTTSSAEATTRMRSSARSSPGPRHGAGRGGRSHERYASGDVRDERPPPVPHPRRVRNGARSVTRRPHLVAAAAVVLAAVALGGALALAGGGAGAPAPARALAATASFTPRTHLFGDPVTARVDV